MRYFEAGHNGLARIAPSPLRGGLGWGARASDQT